MFKIFHRLFDSWRVKDDVSNIVHIGKRHIGVIEFYPSERNPFMERYGHVRVYDNGELFVDEYLVKLITYTDSHREFMEFCFYLWKNKTNQKIYPNCIILSCEVVGWSERIAYRDFSNINYLVE
jgi:hypothetical protein